MLSSNPNLALKCQTIPTKLTFLQIKTSKLGLQAAKAMILITLRGLRPNELKPAKMNIFIVSPMIWSFNLVIAGRIEGPRDPPGRQVEITVDLTFWLFSQKLKRLQTSQPQFWILLKYIF